MKTKNLWRRIDWQTFNIFNATFPSIHNWYIINSTWREAIPKMHNIQSEANVWNTIQFIPETAFTIFMKFSFWGSMCNIVDFQVVFTLMLDLLFFQKYNELSDKGNIT